MHPGCPATWELWVLCNNPLAKILRVRNVNPALNVSNTSVSSHSVLCTCPVAFARRSLCTAAATGSSVVPSPSMQLSDVAQDVNFLSSYECGAKGVDLEHGWVKENNPLVILLSRIRGPLDERVRPVRPLRIPGGDGGSSRNRRG